MGRASSSKKVSRAASTGGGRTARGSRPLGWYALILVVLLLGVAGIVVSRAEYREEAQVAAGEAGVPPIVRQDHWHSAVGFYLCDEFAPDIQDDRDPKGIHTHADGIIHVHPTLPSAAGENAVLSEFTDAVRMTLDDKRIRLPGGKTFTEGETKCDGKPGKIQVKVNGDEVVTEDVRNIRFTDRQLLTVAFAPDGAELPNPPSAPNLDNLSDVDPPVSTPTELPVPDVPTSEAQDGASEGADTTVAGAESSPTSAP